MGWILTVIAVIFLFYLLGKGFIEPLVDELISLTGSETLGFHLGFWGSLFIFIGVPIIFCNLFGYQGLILWILGLILLFVILSQQETEVSGNSSTGSETVKTNSIKDKATYLLLQLLPEKKHLTLVNYLLLNEFLRLLKRIAILLNTIRHISQTKKMIKFDPFTSIG